MGHMTNQVPFKRARLDGVNSGKMHCDMLERHTKATTATEGTEVVGEKLKQRNYPRVVWFYIYLFS